MTRAVPNIAGDFDLTIYPSGGVLYHCLHCHNGFGSPSLHKPGSQDCRDALEERKLSRADR